MSDELMVWAEIDVERCSRRFGVSPCMAALSSAVPCKCVNTFATCAYDAAYEAETVTLVLTPKDQVWLPFYEPVPVAAPNDDVIAMTSGGAAYMTSGGEMVTVSPDALARILGAV